MTTAAQLDLIFRAQDHASRVIRGISKDVGGLDASFKKLGLGGVASVGALTGAVTAFAAGGLREFAEAERVMGQTEAALKSTGSAAGVTADDIGNLSDKFMRLAAVDDEVIQSAANVMLTFTNIKNVGVDNIFDQASLAALNLSARLGTDLQSATILVGKALNDPIKGLTALSKAGIQFSQDQKDMIRAMMDAGDVMGAQKIILKELEVQFGGSAEAAGKTMAGQLKILQLRFENFEGEVMGKTVPAILALTGFVGDAAVAFGKLEDAVGSITDPLGDAFGFISDALDKVPDEVKMVGGALVTLAGGPLSAATAGLYAATRVIDFFSEDTDTATVSTNDFATALENAQGHAMMAQGAINNARTAISAPMAAAGIRDSLQGMADDAYAARDAADKAKTAFFDLLHQPSQERQTRQYMLDQAEFNVGQLQAQVDNGMGKVASGVGDFDKEGYLNWLTNEFIPAQEEWLHLDELNVDRQESAAILAQTMTGDYKNLFAVIDGKIVPAMGRYNGALYDAKGNLVNLAAFNPTTLEVKTKVDKPPDPSKIKPELKSYINDVNEWLKQWPFNWGFDDPPLPPREFTKNEARAFVKDVNDFLKNFPFNWHIPDPKFPKRDFTKQEARDFIKDVNDFLKKFPFNFNIPEPDFPKVEPTKEDVRAFVKDVNEFFKNLPFNWHIPDPTQPKLSDITPPLRTLITDTNTFFANTPFNWHIPTPWAPPDADLKQKVVEIIGRIRYWWSQISPFGGMTFNPTTLETAQALKPQLAAAVNRPDNRGMAMGGGDLHVHFHGQADLSTPTGRQYVVNTLWGELNAKMRTG